MKNRNLLTYKTFAFAYLLLVAGCSSFELKRQDVEINVGDVLQYSFDFDNEDPFENIEIDTVKVTGINGLYVQWEYKEGYRLSGKLKYFKHNTRPCH